MPNSNGKDQEKIKSKRVQLSQTDVPSYPLEQALRVPWALRDEYGKQKTRPMLVAKAMKMSPGSGPFRSLTGAAVAYGLTEGASHAEKIALAPLGRRVVSPTVEGDNDQAIREAVLKPRVISEFLRKYDGSKLPSKEIALNILEEMGVPLKSTERAYEMILSNASYAGFLSEISGKKYVNLDASGSSANLSDASTSQSGESTEESNELDAGKEEVSQKTTPSTPSNDLKTNKRVFVTHGKNRDIVNQLKEVLTYGGLEPVVSVEAEAVAKPVPDKVMDEMRSCGAGIVHVSMDKKLIDEKGDEHVILNQNVLVEIGAALALYNRNFILLVEENVELPSNLQGLYEVRYSGKKLDYEATMKLLKAFNDFRSTSLTQD